MAGALHCQILSRFAELEAVASEWDRLWASNPRRQIFNRFSWIRAWWQGYGRTLSLCTPVALRDGKVVGILPLVRQEAQLRFLGEPGSDYNDVLCEGAETPRILEALLDALCGMPGKLWRTATLENVPEHSLLLTHMSDLPGRWQRRFATTPGHLCPTVVLDEENREATLRAILDQKEPRQHETKLQKLGKLTFRHIEDREEVRRHLPLFFEQHIQRWAMTADGDSRFRGEQSRVFYEALVEELDPRNDLRFAVMEIDGRPIAYHFGFQLDGKFIHYKPTFDINLWKESPGQVMNRSLFSYAKSVGVREFDFTIGNEVYKSRFANQSRRNFTVRLYRPGPRNFAARKLSLLRQRFDKGQRPFALLKTLRSTVRSVLKRARGLERRGGPLTLFGKALVATFRTVLFASDRVFLFSSEQGDPSELDTAPCPPDSSLGLVAATLGDLANCSVAEPEPLDRSQLQAARGRLKKGDVPYVTYAGNKLVCLAWIGTRNNLSPLEVDLNCQVPLPRPAAVIYDLWFPASLREKADPRMLRAMVSLSHRKGLDAWIYCNDGDVVLRKSIEAAGFLMRYRVERTRLFGLSSTRLQPVTLVPSSSMRGSVRIPDPYSAP
ncbi:MAG TPA: GNAT family N-acetyltransferase [Candidatus Acidoferrales bacterium]|nr:GNAT family N-acetyltransferase [Candidatus Acidoferrales bacterium]